MHYFRSAALVFLCALPLAPVHAQTTTLISIASVETSGNAESGQFSPPSISADGRYVAFSSSASTLVPDDTAGMRDIFVRDMQTGDTRRVSLAADGRQGNNYSYRPSISADGRYVAFYSWASNFVTDDTNSTIDVFVKDTTTGSIKCASSTPDGAVGNGSSYNPSISADGRYVAFMSEAGNLVQGDTNGVADVFVKDTATGAVTLVSVGLKGAQGNGASHNPSISADGRYVAFSSTASNLVTGDANGWQDIFVRDLTAGTTRRVSVRSTGVQGNSGSYNPSISADGRYVAFSSLSAYLVPSDSNGKEDVFVKDTVTGALNMVSVSSAGAIGISPSTLPSISADGRYVTFTSAAPNLVPGDTNLKMDVFVRDAVSGTTERVSITSDGAQANDDSGYPVSAAISADGKHVAFPSKASNLFLGDAYGVWDIFVRNRETGTTSLVSVASKNVGNGASGAPSISADGRYVAFISAAPNLVPNDTNNAMDIFLRDTVTGSTVRASVASDGTQTNGASGARSISADGRYVAFVSAAPNLVPNDTNGVDDVFVRDTIAGTTQRVSIGSNGSQGDRSSKGCVISADGRFVAFVNPGSNLVRGDGNGKSHVYAHDLVSGTTTRVSVSSTGRLGSDSSGDRGIAISADGRYVAFDSFASNLVPGDTNAMEDIFVRDLVAGTTTLVSVASDGTQASDGSDLPSITPDGRYVAFRSAAGNLVAGDANAKQDIFVRDTVAETTALASVASDGTQGNDNVGAPSISADGGYVAFESAASNLMPGDANAASDVFVRDMEAGILTRVSLAADGAQVNGASHSPSLSADGRYVAFTSSGSNLVPGDTNGLADVFVRGPFTTPLPQDILSDVVQILRFAGGLDTATRADRDRLNVERVIGPNTLDLWDAVTRYRATAGRPGIFQFGMEDSLLSQNGLAPATATGISFVDGRVGRAASFGPGALLHYPAHGAIDPRLGTLMFWVRPHWNGNDGLNHAFLTYPGGGGMFFDKNGNNLRIILNRWGDEAPEIIAAFNISDWKAGVWHHVAYTWSNATSRIRIYVDGSLVAQEDARVPFNPVSSPTFQIGGDGNFENVDADMDEIEIRGEALAAQEIAGAYHSAF